MAELEYDLVVIGMGSGGLTAAEFAAGLGLRVAAVERDRLGGDCLWTGCVPSKALLASAKVAHTMRTAHRVGITSVEPVIDLPTVWRRARAVQAEIAATDDNPQRYRDLGVELISGEAMVTGPNEVALHTPGQAPRVLTTRFILLCTGSRPRIPTIDGLDPLRCLTSEQLFHVHEPPPTMAIIGGGPMGVEMAQALQRLGVAVTIFQRARTLLPQEEPTLVERLSEVLAEEGVAVHCSADVRSLRHLEDGTTAVSAIVGDRGHSVELTVDGVLLAAGRVATTTGLGLDDVGVTTNEQGVVVDDRGRTSIRTIYAAGDVAGRRLLTNAAGYEAVRAVRDMFFPGRGSLDSPVPSCIFTDPELARVGLTVEQAEAVHGTDTDVWRLDLTRNDRARTDARDEGSVVIVTAKGRVVGAHVLAPVAGEVIHELTLAIQHELKLDEVAEALHVYPTYGGAIGQVATEAAYEKALRLRWLMKRR
ncbi:MAG: FAD-dependent oxidoreductase [Ilumatobacteraceae bacterium]